MSLRGWSKDRSSRKVTPPGPSYMNNDQFASYLAGLRNNRVARPTGARPPPASKAPRRRDSDNEPSATGPAEDVVTDIPPRSESAASNMRSYSALSNYSTSSRRGRALVQQPYSGLASPQLPADRVLKPSEVVPTSVYMERGQRWMEMEDACALREAMEDMRITKEQQEEARLHAAAQKEASELVHQHQYPEEIPHKDDPYRYKEHLQKNSYAHARTASVSGRYSPVPTMRSTSRSVSNSSNSSGDGPQKQRVVSGSSSASLGARPSVNIRQPGAVPRKSSKSYGGLSQVCDGQPKRRSSGRRNISGEPDGSFSPAQIYEEPEDEELRSSSSKASDIPAPLRLKSKNPLNRVQFTDGPHRSQSTPPESKPKLSKYEIHQNPPSQSRNPLYTANSAPQVERVNKPSTPTKDGLEIRGDDIRQATSKSLKDRSPKLPTPVAVSDKPGRPIVSFDPDWKPKEADIKPVKDPRGTQLDYTLASTSGSKELPRFSAAKTLPQAPVPTFQFSEPPTIQLNHTPLPDPIPKIKCSSALIPSINLPDSPSVTVSTASVPAINISDAPSISVSSPDVTVIEPSVASTPSTRPLPDPKTMSRRPNPFQRRNPPNNVHNSGHWSPAPAGSHATATCHQCSLPIEGRVVTVRGHPERFHPQCLICYTCGTALEALEISPEPPAHRSSRLARISRRAQGEVLPDIEGQGMAEDGDEKLRFYCHLDWHELYAPRCKHCTTPIIGEHAVALGQHWHYGHFFCAECGDPFEQGMTHVEIDGYAWCVRCCGKRTERRAPKCRKCKGPVVGEYVEALGGEWHEACFRCVDCGGAFEDGQIFPREEDAGTVAACLNCMQRQWKA